MKRASILGTAITTLALVACTTKPSPDKAAASVSATAQAPAATASAAAAHALPLIREGAAIARSPHDDALYVADEDHSAVRVVPLPLNAAAAFATITLPGPPASVVALADKVLVTVRNPGLLIIYQIDDGKLVESSRVPVPADAWGIGVTKDERFAVVSSAWTHKVSLVDLSKSQVAWTVDVPREPRAVVVRGDGKAAYVTHLVGADITKIGPVDGAPAEVKRIALPAAPLRAPTGIPLDASLAYAAVQSPDGKNLFIARHAIGALGRTNWYGRATIDVLLEDKEESLAPSADPKPISAVSDTAFQFGGGHSKDPEDNPFAQPRAMAYRASNQSLWVIGEGQPTLYELDAQSIEPAGRPLATQLIPLCPIPTGIVLSKDDDHAFVWCRGSYSIATMQLHPPKEAAAQEQRPRVVVGEDTLSADAADGRKLFFNATDEAVSGGLGCAGCHPEGRDDGHVWHEVNLGDASASFRAIAQNEEESPERAGFPVQTPMLAGRVNAEGPYGWYAQDKNLFYRLRAGVDLHRWISPSWEAQRTEMRPKINHLIAYLRQGLIPPPRETHPPTPEEARGKAVFESAEAGCAHCHISKPKYEFTDRAPYPLRKLDPLPGFEKEPPEMAFRTPSLLYLDGTAPYGHDGRYKTLEDLVDQNGDRMGNTATLNKADRAALVAFLRTL